MGAILAIITVIVCLIIGVPVVFAFALMTLVLSIIYDIHYSFVMTTGFWSINSVILIALPYDFQQKLRICYARLANLKNILKK